MIKKMYFLFFLMVALAACAKADPEFELPNGYKIWKMNSSEIYLSQADDELIVGPGLDLLGVAGDVIVVHCLEEKFAINGFENMPGYNLVDTKTGAIEKELSLSELQEMLKKKKLAMPELRKFDLYEQAE